MKRLILSLCTLLLFSGCAKYIQNRNVARMGDYALRYPAKFAELANKIDPCVIGAGKSDTTVSFLKPDTTWVPVRPNTDAVPMADLLKSDITISDGKNSHGLTFGGTIQRITTHEIKTIHDTVIDNRALSAMKALYTTANDSLKIRQGQNTQLETEKNGWRKWFWILAGILAAELIGGVAYLVIKIYTKVP